MFMLYFAHWLTYTFKEKLMNILYNSLVRSSPTITITLYPDILDAIKSIHFNELDIKFKRFFRHHSLPLYSTYNI